MIGYYEKSPAKKKRDKAIQRAQTNPHNVKVGQVWRSWDRRLRNVSDVDVATYVVVGFGRGNAHAVCEVTQPDGSMRRQTIRLDRFRENSTGYKLLRDVGAGTP